MEKNCSFAGLGNFACGESRGIQKVVQIGECNEDIYNHLRSCHLTRLTINESELIFARAGHFNPTQEQLTNMTIQSVIRSVSFSIGSILSI
jgi:hypothetical protein